MIHLDDLREATARRAARHVPLAEPPVPDSPPKKPAGARGYGSLRSLLIALDVTATFLVWAAVFLGAGAGPWAHAVLLALAIALFVALANGLQRLYLARTCAIRSVEMGRLARTFAVCGIAAAWAGDVAGASVSSRAAAVGAIGAFAAVATLRAAYAGWLRSCRAQGRFVRRVCVVGTNHEAVSLVDLLEAHPELGYRVVALVGDDAGAREGGFRIPVVSAGSDLLDAVLATGASGVLVAVSAVPAPELDRVVRSLMSAGLHVQISTGLARVGRQRLRFAPLSHQAMFYVEPHGLKQWQAVAKRSLDVVVGAAALFCSLPLLGAAAVAIKLDDSGPVIYRQERVGRDGRTFQVLKLRTMVPDASSRLGALAQFNERNGPLFKLATDPRVTRVGRFLRATSLDELPQLINVLRGEMSLVGPRPALPSEVEKFDLELLERVSVPPGMTGLWQVEARDNPSFHAYRRLDLFYVDNWSITMDLAIIAGTVRVVIGRACRAIRGGSELVRSDDRAQPPAILRATASDTSAMSPSSALGRLPG